jgi:hypothetical protein
MALPEPSSAGARRVQLACALAALAGCAFTVATFFPGYLTPDSISQLTQARTGQFNAHHPPVLAALWRPLDALVPGPFLMLVAQNVVFWGAAGLLVASTVRSWAAPLLVLALGLWPAVLADLATIWKDVHLGVAMLAATALLLLAQRRGSRLALAGAAGALLWAGLVRKNGLSAVAPLALWWGWLLAAGVPRRPRPWLALVAGASLCAATLLTAAALDAALTRDRPIPPHNQLQMTMIQDLLGVTAVTGQVYLPAYVLEQPEARSLGWLLRCWSPLSSAALFFEPTFLQLSSDPKDLQELHASWRRAVLEHPDVYLRHRAQMMAHLLGWGTPRPHNPFAWDIDRNDLGVVLRRSPLNVAVQRALISVADSWLFRGWIYLAAAALVLAVAAARRRAGGLAVALVASSLCYAAPYFFVAPEGDFRYVWWCALAALALPFTLRPRPGSAPGPAEA